STITSLSAEPRANMCLMSVRLPAAILTSACLLTARSASADDSEDPQRFMNVDTWRVHVGETISGSQKSGICASSVGHKSEGTAILKLTQNIGPVRTWEGPLTAQTQLDEKWECANGSVRYGATASGAGAPAKAKVMLTIKAIPGDQPSYDISVVGMG